MGEVITDSTALWTDEDLEAVARYLLAECARRSLPGLAGQAHLDEGYRTLRSFLLP